MPQTRDPGVENGIPLPPCMIEWPRCCDAAMLHRGRQPLLVQCTSLPWKARTSAGEPCFCSIRQGLQEHILQCHARLRGERELLTWRGRKTSFLISTASHCKDAGEA